MTGLRAAILLSLACPLALLAGCASTARPGPTTPAASAEEQELARAYDELLRASDDFRTEHAETPAARIAGGRVLRRRQGTLSGGHRRRSGARLSDEEVAARPGAPG